MATCNTQTIRSSSKRSQHQDEFISSAQPQQAEIKAYRKDSTEKTEPAKKKSLSKKHRKPKRPLSAYNLFYKFDRERLLAGVDKPPTNADVLRLSHEDKLKPKRSHRKTHGMIGFKDLARAVGTRWKSLSPSYKQLFEEQAKQEKIEYNQKIIAFKHQQLKDLAASDIPSREEEASTSYAFVPSSIAGGDETEDLLDLLNDSGLLDGTEVGLLLSENLQQDDLAGQNQHHDLIYYPTMHSSSSWPFLEEKPEQEAGYVSISIGTSQWCETLFPSGLATTTSKNHHAEKLHYQDIMFRLLSTPLDPYEMDDLFADN